MFNNYLKLPKALMKKLFILVLLFPLTLSAQQRIPVQEGVEVNAVASRQALNQLSVEDDRITSVKGISGQFDLEKDEVLGQIFFKPINLESPIHLFVTTEKGHTYHLGLTTHELGSESIVLVPLEEKAFKWQQSSAYESLIKTLMQAMHTQTALEGFVVENAKVKLPKIKGIKVVQLQSYLGQSLLGQVLEATNTSNETLHLTEAEFYLPGVRAIAMINKTLAPKAKTRIYLVRN